MESLRPVLQTCSVVLIISALAARSVPAFAQASDTNGARRSSHVVVSNGAKLKRLGGARSVLHFGFGMEWRHPLGLGIRMEAGPRFEDHKLSRFDDLMLSADATYHVRSRSNPGKVVPFLAGGLSLAWEPPPGEMQQTSFVGFGGGVTYWVSTRRGIQFELRDAVTLDEPQTGYHYLSFRIGYTWLNGPQ